MLLVITFFRLNCCCIVHGFPRYGQCAKHECVEIVTEDGIITSSQCVSRKLYIYSHVVIG